MAKQVAPLAGAYDEFRCEAGMAGRPVRDVDYISFDSGWDGKVDFGDDPHLLGGPRGNAVVCWYDGRGSAQVWGKLYWDGFDKGCGSVRIDFFNTSGHTVPSDTFVFGVEADPAEVCSAQGGLRSLEVNATAGFGADEANLNLKRVRVRLFREGALVGTINRYYGD
jgi:hypothetical protein